MLPQLIYLLIIVVGFTINCMKHGKPQTGNYNGWLSFLASIITLLILWWGGFFDVMINIR